MAKKRAKKETLPALRPRSETAPAKLLNELRDLIQSTRSGVAQAVNSALVLLYWGASGTASARDILKEKRASYGKQIVEALSRRLAAEYGKGSPQNKCDPDDEACRKVRRPENSQGAVTNNWAGAIFVLLLPIKDALQTRLLRRNVPPRAGWSIRALQQKIGGMLFERTALSRKPAELARMELEGLATLGKKPRSDARPGFPRPLLPRLPRSERYLCREGR